MSRRTSTTATLLLLALLVLGGLSAHSVRSQEAPLKPEPLRPVSIVRLVAQPGGARVELAKTPDAPNVAVRVDPRGGGDVATIADALRRVTKGEIALAAGTYTVDAFELPPGVSLAGGFDPQTWASLPSINPTVLVPKDPRSARALIRLTSGSRLSAVEVRGAQVCVELTGDGVVVQGVGVSHCGTGILTRSSARGLITYITAIRSSIGVLLEPGSEVAVQNSIFQRNEIGVLHGGSSRAPAAVAGASVADPLAFPLPSINNLFFENPIPFSEPALEAGYTSDPGLVRLDTAVATDEERDQEPVSVLLPEAPLYDDTVIRLASLPFGREGDAPIQAVHIESSLSSGDRVILLDAADGNLPVAEIDGSYSGWKIIPSTTRVVLQLVTNGDGKAEGTVAVDAVAEVDEEDLRLRPDLSPDRDAMLGSTEGGPIGMTGAFDPLAPWYEPVAPQTAPAVISGEEERELLVLESALAPLTRQAATGDPVVRDEDGGWVWLDGEFRSGGNPGATYYQQLSGGSRQERSINALLSEVGVASDGAPRTVLIDETTLKPSASNYHTSPKVITAFRLDGFPDTALGASTLEGLEKSVEAALNIGSERREDALSYARISLGEEAGPNEATLLRLADFYGAVVSESFSADTRREVAVGEWLVALLQRERGGSLQAPETRPYGSCASLADCPERVPQISDAPPRLSADADEVTIAPAQARTNGPWTSVVAGRPPLNVALTGLLTSTVPLAAVGLPANSGAAELTYTYVPVRTAKTRMTLTRLEGRAMSPLTISLRGPMGSRTLLRGTGDASRVVDDVLGDFPLVAGEPVEVKVRGGTMLLGALVLRAEGALPESLYSPLSSAGPTLAATGGAFSEAGWTTDAALSSLKLRQRVDASGQRMTLRISGYAPCPAEAICPPDRLFTLRAGDVEFPVSREGSALVLDAYEHRLQLPLPQSNTALIEVELRRIGTVQVLRFSAGASAPTLATSVMVLPITGEPATQLDLEFGSLDPEAPTVAGLTFSRLLIVPVSAGRTVAERTSRLSMTRRDAQAIVVFASTDPSSVIGRSAPKTVLPLASLRPTQRLEVELTGFKNGTPVTVAAAVMGPDGELSDLSEIRTVVPEAEADVAPPPAIATFSSDAVYDQTAASFTAAERLVRPGVLKPVPASRLTITLGERLVLNPSMSIPSGATDLLVSWSIGRDQNIATEPAARHVYRDVGTYRPTLSLLKADGQVIRIATPPVTVALPGTDTVSASLLLGQQNGLLQPGGTLAVRGVIRGEELTVLPRSWSARLDPGNGSPVIDGTEALRSALLGPASTPVNLTYPEAGSYTLTLTIDDETGKRRATTRQTILVGTFDTLSNVQYDIGPLRLAPTEQLRVRVGTLPRGMRLLAWNFGDALTDEEQSQLPTATGIGEYGPPQPMTTTPLQVLGDLPVYFRVRTPSGDVSFGSSSLTVQSPGANFELKRSLLFGNVSAGLNERTLALFRVRPDGQRSYVADVTVDREGFVLLPVSPARTDQVVAAVRAEDRSEYLALDGVGQLRTTLPLSVKPSPGGFTWSWARTSPSAAGVTLRAVFAPDATVNVVDGETSDTRVRRGLFLRDLAEGVSLGADGGVPALIRSGKTLISLDLKQAPRLAGGVSLEANTGTAFTPPVIIIRSGEEILARLQVQPDGPVRQEATDGEGFVLSATGDVGVAIDPASQVVIRTGDRLVLAARDARGELSKDLVSIVVREEDLQLGRAPAFGIASPGSRELQGLDETEKVLQTNSNQPTFFGVADPGETVKVTTHSETQEYTVMTDASGAWKLVPAHPLEEGSHTVEIDVGGVRRTFPMLVDKTPPPAPEVTGISGRIITGRAEPGSTVAVYDQANGELGAVLADEEGLFRFTSKARLVSVLLKAVDAAGNTSTAARLQLGQTDTAVSDSWGWKTTAGFILAIAGFTGLVLLVRAARKSPIDVH